MRIRSQRKQGAGEVVCGQTGVAFQIGSQAYGLEAALVILDPAHYSLDSCDDQQKQSLGLCDREELTQRMIDDDEDRFEELTIAV